MYHTSQRYHYFGTGTVGTVGERVILPNVNRRDVELWDLHLEAPCLLDTSPYRLQTTDYRLQTSVLYSVMVRSSDIEDLLFIIYYLLLIIYYLLLIIYYLLFIIYYLLFIICDGPGRLKNGFRQYIVVRRYE